jgi:hypothetical protein
MLRLLAGISVGVLVATAGCLMPEADPPPSGPNASAHGLRPAAADDDGPVEDPSWDRSPNPPQSGSGTDCLDHNLLWDVDPLSSPLASIIQVEPGSFYTLALKPYEHSDVWNASVAIAFFDDADHPIRPPSFDATGIVHHEAAYAIPCTSLLGSRPDVPVPILEWEYQDGFPMDPGAS